MKNSKRVLFRILLSVAIASTVTIASGDVTKDNNSDALNVGTSYTSPFTVPTGTDVLFVDATMTAAQTPSLGDDVSVLGILASSGNELTVGAVAGKALTIGTSGISKSGAGGLTFNNTTNLAGDLFMTTGTSALTFGGALMLTGNQNWTLGNGRINLNNTLTTGGSTLNISANNANSGILSFSGNKTLSTDVTIGSLQNVWIQNGTITFDGVNNTNSGFAIFGGTVNIASMGTLTGASSIGKGSAAIRATSTLNYTGTTFTSNKGMTRDTNSGLALGNTTFNVTTAGETLTMSGNFVHSGTNQSGAWIFGGDGNLTLTGNIVNGVSTAVTKNGTGTLTLSGANTYTGATTVTAGTLSLVGGSQASPITVNSGAALGFTIGSPSTSTSTVTFSGATAKVAVSGTPAATTLMTAASFTGVPVLDPGIPGFTLVTTSTELNLVSTAAQGVKADNGDALNLATSWIGDVPPTASTFMIVDNTLTAARTAVLGDNLSVLGISASSGFGLTINGTTGKTLTIGSSGITKIGAGGLTFNNATSLGGNLTGGMTFDGALTLTANQTWSLGGGRINLKNLTTSGNALDISSSTGGILSITGTTLSSDVTIGTLGNLYAQGGTMAITGTNNTNSGYSQFGGTMSIASMGNLTGASSIGKGSAYVRSGATLNFTGNSETSNKGISRDNNGTSSTSPTTINVTTTGQTLSMSGNLTNGATNVASGWVFGGAGNLTLSGIISNSTAAGTPATTVTKNGTGTLTLSGPNPYTGSTAVNLGTLALVGGSLTSPITVSSGAALGFTLGSPATSTSTVHFDGATAKVTVSGTPAAMTLMTATSITGTPVLDPAVPGYVLAIEDGNTTLKLKVAAGSTYNAWASTNGVSGQAAALDHDNDGVANGIEFFLVGPSTVSTGFTPLPAITTGSGTRSITWVKAANYTGSYGTDFIVETSTTLSTGSWTTETLGGTVTISGNNVTYTFPSGTEKRFARLNITRP